MSEDKTPESGQADATESGAADKLEVTKSAEELTAQLVTVSAEAKKRRLENQGLKTELSDLTNRLKSIEDSKLEEQGQFKEAWEKTKQELSEVKGKLTAKEEKYKMSVIASQIATEAVKLGCLDTRSMVQLAYNDGLLKDLEIDDDFNVSAESVSAVVDSFRKTRPYMFGKKTPDIKDGVPANGKPAAEAGGIENLSLEEKTKKLAQLFS